MKNSLILHGKPKKERYLDPSQPKPHEANWLPWLAGQLQQRGIPTRIPAFPEPYAPDYNLWRSTFEQYPVNKTTGIVGHSAGAGFIVRWLSERPAVKVDRIVLVAPWHDAKHEYGRSFFDYTIDPLLSERVGRLSILNSTDDGQVIQESVKMLRATIPGIHYRELEGFGHFMTGNKMMKPEFPELLEECNK